MILSTLDAPHIIERMLALPVDLQMALDDLEIRQLVDDAGRAAGLSGTDLSTFEALVSLVLMGFLHPEALYDELIDTFGMAAPTADAIAKRLKEELFDGFADLLPKVYAPVKSEVVVSSAAAPAPVPPTALANPAAPAAPKINPFGLGAVPRPVAPLPAAPLPPKPTPTGLAPTAETSARVSPPAPAPFMLRKETTTTPAAPGFKLDLDPSLFGGKPKNVPQPMRPGKPAQLELGAAPEPRKPEVGIPAAPAAARRSIRYAAPQTSIGIPAAPAAPRSEDRERSAENTVPFPVRPNPVPASNTSAGQIAPPAPLSAPIRPGAPLPAPSSPVAKPGGSDLPHSRLDIPFIAPDLKASAAKEIAKIAPAKDLAPHLLPPAPAPLPRPALPDAAKPVEPPSPPAPPFVNPSPAEFVRDTAAAEARPMPRVPSAAPAPEPKKPPRIVNFTEGEDTK